LGKRSKIVYQGFGGYRSTQKRTVFTEFPQFDREWNHNGVTKNNFKEFLLTTVVPSCFN